MAKDEVHFRHRPVRRRRAAGVTVSMPRLAAFFLWGGLLTAALSAAEAQTETAADEAIEELSRHASRGGRRH